MKDIEDKSGYSVGEVKTGKYLKILLRTKENVISDIKIIGDFFAFPETAIDALEAKLIGKNLKEALKIIDNYEMTLVGVSKEDLKNALKKAFKCSQGV